MRVVTWLLVSLGVVLIFPSSALAASWHVVPSPNPSSTNSELTDVSASSATNVWAAGPNAMLRWNGSSWTTKPRPDFPVQNIVALSATNVIAQGASKVSRWNGTKWAALPTPPGRQRRP
jgi:hypothetical protein